VNYFYLILKEAKGKNFQEKEKQEKHMLVH